MIDKTKITLSAKELELVCNTDWILTKHIIIEKVIDFFSAMLISMQQKTSEQKNNLPVEVFIKDPKISRGENYRQLPYVMLDYPRYFEKQDTLAIRTFFWWGNFFSINMQLSGNIKNSVVNNLISNFLHLQQNDYWICVNNNPWQHYFEEDNYLPLGIANLKTVSGEQSVVKIANKIPLQEWDHINSLLFQNFTVLFSLLLSEH